MTTAEDMVAKRMNEYLSNVPEGPMQDIQNGEPFYSQNPGVQRKMMYKREWDNQPQSPSFFDMLRGLMQ